MTDFGPNNLPDGWDDACHWAATYCRKMFDKEWHDDSIAHEYMAARNGYLAGRDSRNWLHAELAELRENLRDTIGNDYARVVEDIERRLR